MTRPPRIQFPGALYHIIQRGNNRQEIFFDENDYSRFLATLKEYKEKFGFSLYAYCLMPNHFHLLMETAKILLAKIMQPLLTSYTMYLNKKYDRAGHIFQGRYKSILCDKDNYLLELTRYIHLNPVKAGITNRPENYQWSSYRSYLVKENGFVTTAAVLSYFGTKKPVENYVAFVSEKLTNLESLQYPPIHHQMYVGNENFVKKMQSLYRRKSKIKA